MRLIVLGAGPIGNSLIKLASDSGHDVVMIEPDEARSAHCADRYDARVLNMDIRDANVAEEARMDGADAIIATTDDDSSNLMAMFLGHELKVGVLTSIVNHDSHLRLFEKLGVHVLADPEVLVASHLYNLTLLPQASDVTSLQHREQIIEIELTDESALAGLTVGEITKRQLLPKSLFLVSIERNDEPFFPTESSRLEAGDHLTVFSRRPVKRDQLSLFTGKKD